MNPSNSYSAGNENQMVQEEPAAKGDVYQTYIDFFEEVYDVVDKNYYKPVPRQKFEHFIDQFKTKIYPQMEGVGKTDDFVRWRSSALLIDALKSDEDIFSGFYPPKPAQEYKESALGTRQDLGLEGTKEEAGFKLTQVEPRSDAYGKGLRIGDVITMIGKDKVKKLTNEEIIDKLTPLIDTVVKIKYLTPGVLKEKTANVISQQYFKQMVFPFTTPVPFIYGINIKHFNQKTAEDIFRFLKFFRSQGDIRGLIIDLRNNPGGPPLAAREISSFFLPPKEDFAYFQKKNQPKAMLDVPEIPEEFRYGGPIVILVNEKSGSASELFAGILQRRGRAVLMGQNSAGQVMLKSMFHFDDESMVVLITARGHHPDGAVFSFDGLVPDKYITPDEEDDIINLAAKYLVYMNMNH